MTATLQSILTRQRQKRWSASVLRWLAVGLLLTVLPLGLLAWADNTWVLTKPWRWCAFALWLVGCLWMLAGALRAFRLPGNRDVAGLLDRGSSRRGGYAISTALELASPRTDQPEESALLARLHAEADSAAAATELAHPHPRKWQTAAACLAVVLVGLANPLALRRLLQPSRDLPYTTLSLAGPATGIEEHEPFAVSGVVRGKVPKTVILQMTGGAEISLPVVAGGGYRHTFDHGVGASVKLVARAGVDGISTPLNVVLRDPLHPVGYEHHLQAPAYTRQPEQIETRAAFSILRGSTGRYGVAFNREIGGVRMIFDNDQVPLDLAPDDARPLKWTAPLPKLPRTVGYHLEAVVPDGSWRTVGDPGQIVVLPDKPPTIEIGTHNEGKLKGPHDTFAMSFEAADDVGLADLRVRYQHVGESDWQEAVIPLTSGEPLKFGTDWKLPLDELHAQPHDMVAVVVQAQDNNTLDGPGIGSSEPILIEIPDDPSAKQGGGGGGGGQEVNPLAIERQIYRDTLRSSLGRKAPAVTELVRRQTDNAKNLADMIDAQAGQPEEYLALLNAARNAALQATVELQFGAGEGDYKRSLEMQGAVINSLVKAARMEKSESGKSKGGKGFSLLSPDTTKSESEKNDAVERALTDLKKLIQQQQDINQQIGETPGASGDSAAGLAQKQEQARESAARIGQQIQSLGQGENGGDPAPAVEQMKQAEQQQALAAAALVRGSGTALTPGESAAAALKRAEQLTASLLGQKSGAAATGPQTSAPGYQNLVEQYSRRLSYDQ